MNFFGGPAGPDEKPEEYEILRARPDRFQHAPQDWVLPATLPVMRKLAEGPNSVVAVQCIQCWPDGITLDLALFLRRAFIDGRMMSSLFHRHPNQRAKEGGLRFGVQFSDGRRVTTVDDPRQAETGAPRMWPGGGGGGQFHFSYELYLTPLPPDGPLTLVVEWLDQEIRETHTELDGTAIRAASAQALEIWSDLPPAIDHHYEGHWPGG